jgi:hypothetical protein
MMDSMIALSYQYNISKTEVENMDLFEYEYNINKINEQIKKNKNK